MSSSSFHSSHSVSIPFHIVPLTHSLHSSTTSSSLYSLIHSTNLPFHFTSFLLLYSSITPVLPLLLRSETEKQFHKASTIGGTKENLVVTMRKNSPAFYTRSITNPCSLRSISDQIYISPAFNTRSITDPSSLMSFRTLGKCPLASCSWLPEPFWMITF